MAYPDTEGNINTSFLSVGHEAYVGLDGETVPANPSAFAADLDIARAPSDRLAEWQVLDPLNIHVLQRLNAQSPVVIDSAGLVVVTMTIAVHPLFGGFSGPIGEYEVTIRFTDQR